MSHPAKAGIHGSGFPPAPTGRDFLIATLAPNYFFSRLALLIEMSARPFRLAK